MTLATTYARALYPLLQEATADRHDTIIANVGRVLATRGHQQLLPRIIKEVERLHARTIVSAPSLVTAHTQTKPEEEVAIARACERLSIQRNSLVHTIDPTVIGGFRIRTNATQIDATYKRKLRTLFTTLTNH